MPPHTLNPTLAGMPKSATLAINERSLELQAQGRDIVKLGLGQSPFPVPPSVVAELQRNAHQKAYLPVEGLPELRDAFCAFLARTEHLQFTADQIIVGPGTKELMFLLQLALEADLLVPAPSWVSYAPQAQIVGRAVHWIATDPADDLRVTPDAIDAICSQTPGRSRLLILNYPGNPTGVSYDAGALEELAAVARRHRIVVLSDEIYSGLRFDGQHVSIARFYPEGTIISNGLSKWCGAGGWRLGAFAFPPELDELRRTIAAAASETFSAVSAPIQYAAITAFLGNDEIDTYLSRSRRLLQALMTWSAARLRDAGATVPEPDGGFYLLPRFGDDCAAFGNGRRPATAAELCNSILDDTGVAILPGSDFGLPSSELHARIAGVDFNGAAALAAFESLAHDAIPDENVLKNYCGPTVTGIERVCAWLRAAR